jgi:Ferritin-like
VTGPTGSAGRGPLAEVLATRGGRAEPEAPFVIEHREALIYMLCQAAEVEHGIMCQYLFAAFSLKQRTDEGLTPEELEAVTRWRHTIGHVATEEMLHLALVQNVLSAIGAAPHLTRPNLPAPARHHPAGVSLTLVPFGGRALQHFMFLERPEGMALEGAKGIDAPVHEAVPLMAEGDIVPQLQDFRPSATCTARSSKVWCTSLTGSASATCSSGRRAHRRRAPISGGPSSWP